MEELKDEYTRDGFLIIISSKNEIFDEETLQMDCTNEKHLAIFTHEYWHSLLHLSTFSRVRDLVLYMSQLSVFSKTLFEEANGSTSGNDSLSEEEQEIFTESFEYLLNQQGGLQKPQESNYTNFKITSSPKVPNNYQKPKLFGKEIPISVVEVKLAFFNENKEVGTSKFNIGLLSIEESIANSIETLVHCKTKNDAIRYNILSKLLDYYDLDSNDHHLIASLGTLAMLTIDPPLNIVKIIEQYRELKLRGKNKDQSLDLIKESVITQMKKYEKSFIQEIESIRDIYEKREPLFTAVKIITSKITSLFEKRLIDPTFDVDCFKEGKLDPNKYSKLTNEIFKPTIILQNRKVKDDLITLDDESHNIKGFGTFNSGNLFKILSLLDHFYKAHYSFTGIRLSDSVIDKCTFYNSCDAPGRMNKEELCRNKPWSLMSTEFDTCEYCQMVSCLIGETQKRS